MPDTELDLSAVDLTTEQIRTDRLLLRPWRPDDEDEVLRACQDPEILRWLTLLPSPYTRADARSYVSEIAPSARADGSGLPVAVEADGRLVASSGLRLREGPLGPEIGYWTAPWARGRGYAAETASALATWAFAHGAARVHLFADVANGPSQAVARRAGFREEGVVRACLPSRNGGRADAALFGRLVGE